MKKLIALLTLTFASSGAFAIPCTTEAISQALNDYASEQPVCISPCEAAKVDKKIYNYGLYLLDANCSVKDPEVLTATDDLNKLLEQAEATIEKTCH